MRAIICFAVICAAASQALAQEEHRRAKAKIQAGTDEGVSGEVFFEQWDMKAPVTIKGKISGLAAGLHGLHVHQNGNLTSACSDAGSHFNPDGSDHGAPSNLANYRHVADLGNVVADMNGMAEFELEDRVQTLFDGNHTIAGRAIVIHAKEDDLGLGGDDESKKTGNAGPRVGCGLIVLEKQK